MGVNRHPFVKDKWDVVCNLVFSPSLKCVHRTRQRTEHRVSCWVDHDTGGSRDTKGKDTGGSRDTHTGTRPEKGFCGNLDVLPFQIKLSE